MLSTASLAGYRFKMGVWCAACDQARIETVAATILTGAGDCPTGTPSTSLAGLCEIGLFGVVQ